MYMDLASIENSALSEAILQASSYIRNGGIVAFPTETYYGLAVDPFNEKALHRLFEFKKRPSSKPILTLIERVDQLAQLVDFIPSQYQRLIDEFWPGPLTLIFPAKQDLSFVLTGGTATVGVRISSNPIAQSLVSKCGFPVTATSANLSGEKPASSPEEVREQFGSSLDFIIEGGETPGGSGSTIIGTDGEGLTVIRSGVIKTSQLVGKCP